MGKSERQVIITIDGIDPRNYTDEEIKRLMDIRFLRVLEIEYYSFGRMKVEIVATEEEAQQVIDMFVE